MPFIFLSLLFLNYPPLKSEDKIDFINLFVNNLKKWNIDYTSLDKHKAGAGCISIDKPNSKEFKALGFSHQMFDQDYARKIALDGCNKMKKKKILSDCVCEIIIVDNVENGEN